MRGMRFCKSVLYLLLAQCPAVAGHAQTTTPFGPDWEKILIPMIWHTPRDGAYGSRWQTRMSLLNSSDHTVVTIPYGVNCRFGNCALPPNLTANLTDDVDRGHWLFVKRADAASLAVNLCVRNLAQPDGICTQIPLAHESDFRPQHLSFLNVPVRAGLRHTLRVFVFESLFDYPGAVVLGVTVYKVSVDGTESPLPIRYFAAELLHPLVRSLSPAELQISDFSQFGDWQGANRLRIDVDALTPPKMHLWGFVSAIDNTSNQITTVTP